jgi:hypothetical protein
MMALKAEMSAFDALPAHIHATSTAPPRTTKLRQIVPPSENFSTNTDVLWIIVIVADRLRFVLDRLLLEDHQRRRTCPIIRSPDFAVDLTRWCLKVLSLVLLLPTSSRRHRIIIPSHAPHS